MVCRSFASASFSSARITSRRPYSRLSSPSFLAPSPYSSRSPTTTSPSSLASLRRLSLTPRLHSNPPPIENNINTSLFPSSSSSSALPVPSDPSKPTASLTPPRERSYAPQTAPAYQPDPFHSRPFPLAPSPPARDFPRIAADDPRSSTVKWLAFGWRYFLFLMRGFKVTWAERAKVKEIRDRVINGGEHTTWKEDLMIRRVKIDLAKLPLMVTITLISDEIIPLILWLLPTALPSTFLLPSQHENILAKRDRSLYQARHELYNLLTEDAKSANPRFDAGWNGEKYYTWTDEDIRAVLKVYGVSTWFYLNRGRLEGKMRWKLRRITENDEMLELQDNAEGLTREQFITALTERGLLAYDLPTSSLPQKLDDYLASSRTSPSFTPLSYLLDQIMIDHPAELEAQKEKDRLAGLELDKEKERNGGYSGWQASVRRVFVSPLPEPSSEGSEIEGAVKEAVDASSAKGGEGEAGASRAGGKE